MTALYSIKCLEALGKKVTIVLSTTGEASLVNEQFTDEFLLAALRDVGTINCPLDSKIPIGDSQNDLLNEISYENYLSLMKMNPPTGSFEVNQFIASSTHLGNGKHHLLSILDSMEDGPRSLRNLCLDRISRSQVLFRRFQKISGTVFSDWKKLYCCCCQKEFIDLSPNTRKLAPALVLQAAVASGHPVLYVSKTHPQRRVRGTSTSFFDLKTLFEYILAKFPIPRDTDMIEFMNVAIAEWMQASTETEQNEPKKMQLTIITEKEMAEMYENWKNGIFQPSEGEPGFFDKPRNSFEIEKGSSMFHQKRDIPAVLRMDASHDSALCRRRNHESAAFNTGAHAIAACLINRACSVSCARKYAANTPESELFNGNDIYFSYVEDTYEVEVTDSKYCQHVKAGVKWYTSCFVA